MWAQQSPYLHVACTYIRHTLYLSIVQTHTCTLYRSVCAHRCRFRPEEAEEGRRTLPKAPQVDRLTRCEIYSSNHFNLSRAGQLKFIPVPNTPNTRPRSLYQDNDAFRVHIEPGPSGVSEKGLFVCGGINIRRQKQPYDGFLDPNIIHTHIQTLQCNMEQAR